MREQLKRLGNQDRHRFTATVKRFGTKRGYRGHTAGTVLLTDVRCDGEPMTDHIWMTCGKWSEPLREGMLISFDARVGSYQAGYRGYRDGYDLPPPRMDYTVQRPTRVQVLPDMLPMLEID